MSYLIQSKWKLFDTSKGVRKGMFLLIIICLVLTLVSSLNVILGLTVLKLLDCTALYSCAVVRLRRKGSNCKACKDDSLSCFAV